MFTTESIVITWPNSGSRCSLLVCRSNDIILSGRNSHSNEEEGNAEQEPVGNRKSKSGVDGVAFPVVQVSATVDGALAVLADVDGEGDPNGKEKRPVDEFEGESEVLVASWAVNHARCQDPNEREDCPGTLFSKLV